MTKPSLKLKRITLREILLIFIGSTMTAAATRFVFDPAELVTGGVSGLAIIVRVISERYTGFACPLWLSTFVLNIPIFLFAIRTNGFRRILRTGLSWLIMTVELAFFPYFDLVQGNLLLASLYGGILFGAGSGLLLLAHATTGGTDLLGDAVHTYLRHISIGRLIQVFDGCVVVLGALIFGIEHTLYAIISVYVLGKVCDYILGRGRSAKMAFIISEKSPEIAKDILSDLNRGVTGLMGKGLYTGKERTVLMCICTARDIVSVKDIVQVHDPKAFVVVADAAEAMGEGFVGLGDQ